MDLYFYVASALCIILLGFMTGSYAATMKPSGSQNTSLIGLVIFTSLAFGIVGWLLAVWGFGGNADVQTKFLLAFAILVLFPTTLISATVSASQLYGIRNAVATNQQASNE